MNPTIQSIKSRRSVRSFKPEQIKNEELQIIIEAGLFAPSAMNQQPWHVTVVQDPSILESINGDAKSALAQSENEYFRKFGTNDALNILYHAPTVIVVSAQADSHYAATDCAALTQNLLIAAESLNIGSCWLGLANFALKGDKKDSYKQRLMLPDGYEPCFTVALGYKKTGATAAPNRKPNAVTYVR